MNCLRNYFRCRRYRKIRRLRSELRFLKYQIEEIPKQIAWMREINTMCAKESAERVDVTRQTRLRGRNREIENDTAVLRSCHARAKKIRMQLSRFIS